MQIDALNDRLEGQKTECSAAVDALQTNFEAERNLVQDLEAKIAALSERIDSLTQVDIPALDAKIEERATEFREADRVIHAKVDALVSAEDKGEKAEEKEAVDANCIQAEKKKCRGVKHKKAKTVCMEELKTKCTS